MTKRTTAKVPMPRVPAAANGLTSGDDDGAGVRRPFALPVAAPILNRLPGPLPSTSARASTAAAVPTALVPPPAPSMAASPRDLPTGGPMSLSDSEPGEPHIVTGPARLDRRGDRLLAQLAPGDVAVIDMIDISLDTARALVTRRPAAVVNASSSVTGRAPGLGPVALIEAGVRLVDDVGSHLLAVLDDGDRVSVTPDGRIMRGGRQVAAGTVHDGTSVARAARQGRTAVKAQLAAFGASVPAVFEEERHLLLDARALIPDGAPAADNDPPELVALLREAGRRGHRRARALGRRPALVLFPGPRAIEDVRAVARLVRSGALLVAAGEGARCAVAGRIRPHVVVGESRDLDDATLTCGAVVVHVCGPRAPEADVAEARERLHRLAVPHAVWRTGLDAGDAATVLAVTSGTPFVVVAGARRGLLEFAEQKAAGMAGAGLTQAAWGHRIVDAAVAGALLRPRQAWAPALSLLLAGSLSLGGVLVAIGSGHDVPAALWQGATRVVSGAGAALDGFPGARP